MIHLHIKGDLSAAFKAADARHVELTSIQVRYRHGIAECFASARSTIHNLDFVRRWYHEDAELLMGFGYPEGTLLLFSEDELVLNPR